ncbi:CHAP domain-containing protein [Lentzea nigeriaca]|uniref:CHAP domain-containing protein n=1 Tax=Lentzea nigeriaca TaxID=1128665 RepID=UPI001956C3D4|nr:CHAP domain-containing protein [Lentzea nigeriaca]MBM7857057.1 surface antigen [Lentzea nigeriaca]
MRIARVLRRRLVLLAALAVVLAGLITPMAAAVSTTLCTGYQGCAAAGRGNGDYAANSGTSYWGMYPGHNCTNYAAYRLIRNGADASYLRGYGNAYQWGSRAAQYGVAVNGTPAVGSIAWWDSNSNGSGYYGHVAYVEEVGPGYVIVSEDNYGGDFHWKKLTPGGYYPTGFIHFKDVVAPPPALGAPGAITALVHGSRVNLSWGAAAGAADYQVYRDGVLLAAVGGTTYLDARVSPGQSYNYAVVARNSAGTSPPSAKRITTGFEAADRAYLPTKDGPAECGRAGAQNYQALVCTMRTATGWSSAATGAGDWGYLADRTWLPNRDGSVSYCRRVGDGGRVMCDRFDGTAWTSTTSPQIDAGYPENRAVLSTKDGPALCGRAGGDTYQALVCTVLTSSGWRSVTSGPGDWGYSADRSWLVNRDGTVSYCGRVGDGGRVRCDRFDGMAWSSSISGQVDVGYPDNRTYLATKDGPALCGRAGDPGYQALVCTVQTPSGWVSVTSARGDWGYADRAWLTNADGTVSYCRRVGDGGRVMCDRFDGTAWTSTTSPQVDTAYPDNRAYLSTKDGPALCGRAGDQNYQALVCTVLTPSGWVSVTTGRGDWGYDSDRAWLTGNDGTVSYCRRVGAGSTVLCDRFDGTGWTSVSSPAVDAGYPDSFV